MPRLLFRSIKSLSMGAILRTTKGWRKYWTNRPVLPADPNHPHRAVIVKKLAKFDFRSVLEVGCATGANLYAIKTAYPNKDIGGIDWNIKAI